MQKALERVKKNKIWGIYNHLRKFVTGLGKIWKYSRCQIFATDNSLNIVAQKKFRQLGCEDYLGTIYRRLYEDINI